MRIYREHTGDKKKLLDQIIRQINNVYSKLPYAQVVFILMHPDDWQFLREWLITQPGYENIDEDKRILGNPVIVSADVEIDNIYCTLYPSF